ncbi:DNA phosphorothioation-dependent restriction protein DptH [Prevotella sp. tc2-28]|nr:DNA phosphorothioation-dependent restriction protein DptH [Prevotella sp. tc2-28]
MNANEKVYLRNSLDRISQRIGDGGYTLFDFKEILGVLKRGHLKDNFSTLGYFEDKDIYDMFFSQSEKDLQERVEKNAFLYNQISDIIAQTDGEERKVKLGKYLDDRLINDLARVESVDDIDFSNVAKSIDRKNAAATLSFEDVKLQDDRPDVQLLKRTKGNVKKKSTTFILICDNTENRTTRIRISFNSDIKGLSSEGQPNGRFLYLEVGNEVKAFSVGKENNIHKFIVQRVAAKVGTFDSIHSYFSINKKGAIVVDVPEDVMALTIGAGNNLVQPTFGVLDWSDDFLLNIPMDSADDSDKVKLAISFRNHKVDLIFNLSSNRVQPKTPMAIFEMIWLKGITFHDVATSSFDKSFLKICNEEEEFSVHDYFRKYLRLEKQMIDEGNYAMRWTNKEGEFMGLFVDLPENVRTALDRIFDYFKREKTVPSLCYIDDELEQLYQNYLFEVVVRTINVIPEYRTMSKYELGLTHLGVIEGAERIMFTPFHPIIVAFMLEFKNRFDGQDFQSNTLKLISPYYLIPYLYYNDMEKRPYADKETEDIKTWLFYEGVGSNQQIRTYNITTKMVHEKLTEFIRHFNYLFQDKNCPIVISTIGIKDDSNVIKGLLDFIKDQYATGIVQCVEIHEYVDNLLDETFFERLNRLNSDDLIVKELEKIKESIDSKDYTAHEIIRQLFSRVSFYKHVLDDNNPTIGYCHIAFYQMDTGTEFITPPSSDMRVELSMGGLISIPSTQNKDCEYTIGFGSKGLKYEGTVYQVVSAMNTLYANARNGGRNQFQKSISVSKRFTYKGSTLLQSIYDNANWVTFLHPEVDINFFYKQNLYVVHYTDQYTINAKYDSITVTKHISQYENMLRMAYERYTSGNMNVLQFNETMTDYFNSLNGSWLLGIINKSEFQIREKLSIVAASIIMRHFLSRCKDVIWLPISLDEILRVSGSIGMTQSGLFTAKELGVSGALSDDLLMMGLDVSDKNKPKLLIYPVEVKLAKSSAHTTHGEIQVVHTYKVLKEHLLGERGFTKDIYKTFFASQYLANADKLYANNLLTEEEFDTISQYRFNLLNVEYEISDDVKDLSMGHAALVYFYTSVQHNLEIKIIDDVPVCHINLTQRACFQSVANPEHNFVHFLKENDIYVSDSDYERMRNNTPMPIPNTDETEPEEPDNHPSEVETEITDISLPNAPQSVKPSEQEPVLPVPVVEKPFNRAIRLRVGTSIATNSEVVFEPNNTRMVSHPNMGIIGTMGTGKTQFARSIIAQLSKEGVNNVGNHPVGILVFDYKGDYRDAEFLNAVGGGKAYKYNLPFNPLKLILTDDLEGMNLPAITANRISDSFGKAYGLGVKQQNAIKQLILDTYSDFGITRDAETWGKVTPTMDDVVAKFFEEYDANDSVYALFSTLRDYTIFTNDNSQCVSLFEWLDRVRVIDLTLYPDDTKKLIVSLILDLFYAEMQQLGGSKQEDGYRELRAMIMVDEAHQFLRKDFTALRKIISEGRMFGVGMILSTQNVGDFKTQKEDYTQFILSWVIHHVNSISRSEIASIFGASDTNGDRYQDFINRAKLFESVCKIGSRVEGIRDLPFFELVEQDERFKPKEYDLFE